MFIYFFLLLLIRADAVSSYFFALIAAGMPLRRIEDKLFT